MSSACSPDAPSRPASGPGRTLAAILPAAFALWLVPGSAVPAAPAGAVEGHVRFEGSPPAGTFVAESGSLQKTLYVDAAGSVQFVLVSLPDAAAAPGDPPAAAVTLDQRSFVFLPQVLAVRAGQPVRFTNADLANHNVRARETDPANTFSVSTAAGDASGRRAHRFARTPPERPVRLSCDIHPWMAAWVYAFDHDLFAVTDTGGRFRIENVPAGRHRVAVRQPAAGLERNLAVDVRAGETARIDVRFTSRDVDTRVQ